jgi:chromosome segregation ATPase
MMNVKNSNIYSDKFTLSVVDLNKIEMATEEDKAYGIDKWAKLFKATTWEELKTMAAQNSVFDNVAQSMFLYSCDTNVMEQCQKVEDHRKLMTFKDERIKSLEASNAEKDNHINELEADNDELKASNTDLHNQLTSKDNHISELEAELAAVKAELDKTKR